MGECGALTAGAVASPEPRRWRRIPAILALSVGSVAAPFVFAAAGLTAAGYLLPVRSAAAPEEAIVVLGGFGVPRAELAAQMFPARIAPLVIATGAGDCEAMWRTLVVNGVPPEAIETECASRSTLENAAATAAVLRRRSIASVTLVTHWFHARRAIATFRAVVPGVRFTVASVEPQATPLWRLGWETEPKAVLSEYFKIAWYAVAHGVFIRLSAEPDRGEGA